MKKLFFLLWIVEGAFGKGRETHTVPGYDDRPGWINNSSYAPDHLPGPDDAQQMPSYEEPPREYQYYDHTPYYPDDDGGGDAQSWPESSEED